MSKRLTNVAGDPIAGCCGLAKQLLGEVVKFEQQTYEVMPADIERLHTIPYKVLTSSNNDYFSATLPLPIPCPSQKATVSKSHSHHQRLTYH